MRQGIGRAGSGGSPPAAERGRGRDATSGLSAELLAEVASTAADPLAVLRTTAVGGRVEHVFCWVNAAFGHLIGSPPESLAGRPIRELAARAIDEAVLHHLFECAAEAVETTVRRFDGAVFPAVLSSAPLGTGRDGRWVLSVRENWAEARARDHVLALEDRFRALAEGAPIGIFCSDIGLRLGYANSRCMELLGVAPDDLAGVGWLSAFLDDDREVVVDSLQRVLEGGEIDLPEIRILRPDGSVCWVQLRAAPYRTPGQGGGFIGSIEDITERRSFEARLSHQASHDSLTGLPNRAVLCDSLGRAVGRRAAVDESMVAVVFIDLDDFKLVNDTLGHAAGDELLVSVAQRLASVVRPDDVVARFGGDEFVVLCENVPHRAAVDSIVERILAAVREPVVVCGHEVTVTASVGLVLADSSDPRRVDPQVLLRDADIALYQAKSAGKNQRALFDERARWETVQRLTMANDLRRAIDRGLLNVHYQPIVDLATGWVTGVEALARWRHHSVGNVAPAQFIGLAEENGMVRDLGAWVLRTACEEASEWLRGTGPRPAYVAVNLSARQLCDPRLLSHVEEALRVSGIDGSALCLELTESVLMTEPDEAMQTLRRLKDLGVLLAIDDFGTGYSSLAYLRVFPGDYLKVDRSFVAGLAPGTPDETIVGTVAAMAAALGFQAIAEGVERADQLDAVARLGFGYAQGYHLARPRPATAVADLLRVPLLPEPPLTPPNGKARG